MKCVVCGCTDDRACPGGCYWIADNLCSNCGIILTKPYVQELIELLKTSGINSKQKVIAELETLFEDNNYIDEENIYCDYEAGSLESEIARNIEEENDRYYPSIKKEIHHE